MTRMVQCRFKLLVLIAVILVGGVSAASADTREIVTFVDQTSMTAAEAALQGLGCQIIHVLPLINALAIEVSTISADQVSQWLSNSVNGVTGVYDDLGTLIDPICPTPSLATLGCGTECYPWGQQKINVPAEQQSPGYKGSGVTVAILDTGIDPTHTEFSGRIAPGYNALTNGASSPYDDHGHGTHMAGIIAAALNNAGIIGAATEATLAAVKVLDQNGVGYVSDVIAGLQWIYNHGIRLVNMSFGFSGDSTPLRQAIETLYNGGLIMVASVGNRCAAGTYQEDGGGDACGPAATCTAPRNGVLYPAAYSWVIAVASTDSNNNIPGYSLAGPAVDVCAPGGASGPASGKILSTDTTTAGGYGVGYGTSQAAAHVTGAVALAMQKKPAQSFNNIRSILQTTATSLPGYAQQQQGAGLINAKKMIQQLN
jgi:subtilisin family serine protease